MKSLTASLATALLTLPSLFAQGPLAPLAAPGPLMKSLDQIEPRTPISSLPVTNATANVSYGIHANSGSVSHSTALTNTGTDLVALSAVVAFCKAGTTSISGSLTGNLSP